MKRFYENAAVERLAKGWRVLLDGKPIHTPAGQALVLPTEALARAIAAEWQAQGDAIAPQTMPMLRLANTVRDGIASNRVAVIAALMRFGEHDLLCYRAESPPALAMRQAESWDPVLAWARDGLGAALATAPGVGHVEQGPAALAALEKALTGEDDCALAALHVFASITGSLVLALAVTRGHLDVAQAFALSRLDEAHQQETWGLDAEAEARANALAREMDAAMAFLSAGRGP